MLQFMTMPTPQRQPDPASIPAFDGAMRELVKIPKSELDVIRRKEKPKRQASKRKAK
jgi:hypothetical protein